MQSVFKNKKGMSIVTALVGVAITSIMALAIASITNTMSRVQETARARESALSTTFLISSYLQDQNICKQSLLGAAATGLPLTNVEGGNGRQINQIVTPSSQVVLTAGANSNDGIRRMFLEPIKQDTDLARAPLAQSRYLAQLRIQFAQKEGLLGGGISERTIPIFLTLNGSNRAIECRALSEGGGTDSVADEMELLFASPHMDPTNCQGQYYRVSSGRNPASDGQGLNGLNPVDLKTRFQLLTKSPPAFTGTDASSSRSHYGKRYSTDPGIRGPLLDNNTNNSTDPSLRGEVRQIDGVSYYVSPTLANGWGAGHGGGGVSGCGVRHQCVGGSLVSADVGEGCGGGSRD